MTSTRCAASSDYLLWIGSILRDEDSISNPAASPAASRWQRELLGALRHCTPGVLLLAYLPQRLWPAGKLFPFQPDRPPEPPVETVWMRYCNFPSFRARSMVGAMKRELGKLVQIRGRPLAVVTYNPTFENVEFGLHCQNSMGIPWIDLCADAEEPGSDWSLYPAGARGAWGHVFLSHFAFKEGPFRRKLHLEGGIRWCGGSEPAFPESRALLYTGMMSIWGGIDPLVDAFARIADRNVELWICGHGESSAVKRACAMDSRVRFMGMLPAAELEDVYRRASVFVNPRPANVPGNSMNFPSKLLHYLAYGKPVVSTLTPGVSDDYREVVIEAPSGDESALAMKLEYALGLSNAERRQYWEKAKSLAERRSWHVQAKRLADWIAAAQPL